MLSQEPRGRTTPTLITLIVIGLLLMTFHVRLDGGGVVGAMRSGVQTIVSPLQKAAAFVVNPVADIVDSLSNVASLREENTALRTELADAEAALVAVQDQLARLETFEQLYELDTAGGDLGRTVANVIGRPDAFDEALIIDKGTSDGIVAGQPVIDTNGYVVGTVQNASGGIATVVPIMVGPSGVRVMVGEQIGVLTPQVGSEEMALRLDVFTARDPVLVDDRVVTSPGSVSFPAGLPVGRVVEDAAPVADSLTTTVEPFSDPDTLRLVVVLAWPPDPVITTDEGVLVPDETTTTTEGSTTTSTTTGDG
jgi:rod shape-determining protein MreC